MASDLKNQALQLARAGYASMRATGAPCLPEIVESAISAIDAALAQPEAPAEPSDNPERDEFYRVFNESAKLTGHQPTLYDVWLMARGRMDTNHRTIAPVAMQPAVIVRHDELSRDPDGDISIDYSNGVGMLTISITPTGRLAWAVSSAVGSPRPTYDSGHAEVNAEFHPILVEALRRDELATPAPVAQRSAELTDVQKISMAPQPFGISLLKTATGFEAKKLGPITAHVFDAEGDPVFVPGPRTEALLKSVIPPPTNEQRLAQAEAMEQIRRTPLKAQGGRQ